MSDELYRLLEKLDTNRRAKVASTVAAVETITMEDTVRWMLSPDPWADCPRFTESVRRHSIQVYRLIDRHIPEPDFVPQPCGKIYLVLTAINWSAITPEQAALFSDIALRYLSDVSDRMREMKGPIETKQLPFVDALTSDTA